MDNVRKYRVPSVEKAFAILELFAADNRGYTLSEVSRLLHLPVSTANSLLNTLQYCGYVSRRETSRYRLTMKLLAEGSKVVDQLELHRVAERHMEDLTSQTGLTSSSPCAMVSTWFIWTRSTGPVKFVWLRTLAGE